MDALDELLCGYIRTMEITYNLLIPQEIQFIVSIYLMKFSIYGIGLNSTGYLSFGDHEPVLQWKELYDLEQALLSINNIYASFDTLFIIKSLSLG